MQSSFIEHAKFIGKFDLMTGVHRSNGYWQVHQSIGVKLLTLSISSSRRTNTSLIAFSAIAVMPYSKAGSHRAAGGYVICDNEIFF